MTRDISSEVGGSSPWLGTLGQVGESSPPGINSELEPWRRRWGTRDTVRSHRQLDGPDGSHEAVILLVTINLRSS